MLDMTCHSWILTIVVKCDELMKLQFRPGSWFIWSSPHTNLQA